MICCEFGRRLSHPKYPTGGRDQRSRRRRSKASFAACHRYPQEDLLPPKALVTAEVTPFSGMVRGPAHEEVPALVVVVGGEGALGEAAVENR